jgi:hypothetical protein
MALLVAVVPIEKAEHPAARGENVQYVQAVSPK